MKIKLLSCRTAIASLIALGALAGCTVSDQTYSDQTYSDQTYSDQAQNVNTDQTVLIKYQLRTPVYVDQETGCQYFGGPGPGYTIRYDASGTPMCRLTTPN